ncbi:MAG: hypothetical protein MPEBLZ_02565 [Candidatus Methanoperedens nitroreducens]|uniref:Uncharacterized protein n=1 Tax=Candidatus Methanoperedens nitratireducens TaxID=1392998 RepID=A0A0P7ZDV8_9EURY|nr:hypothetical protein [Candidatus Methanoperedens sp. BLZ2]KAB2946819.1 MAG: hypothetical protein F9K14_06610 [Candidatus Methanoperedens sp.]KPQ42883.1 MAG: hypothetical protein MPEBLZ_02565 [Candidatus Methanoperedens sp. BLZ1]MBZ0175758.1 hypothetical protein [Candidatus Methanoperedens nitroreducens]CAG0964450.1 hypothetical protein METP2_01005 [Methanosarcinales archaeon]MCX9079213.1 hypothetical protein [Candidatus Methanoperedens sp.]
MNGLSEMWGLPVFIKKNEPQINADERRFNNRVSSFVHALKSVFAPSAYFAVRLKYAPQRARRTQKKEQ